MTQVMITGATGLVGGHLLRMLRQTPEITAIAAPTRCPLADADGVFNPHDPQLSDALAQVKDPLDIVFCCLGTTRREAGSKEAFIQRIIRWWWIRQSPASDWARNICW